MTTLNPTSPEPLLHLDHCSIQFGGLTAVADLTLNIGNNELLGLIGPNGAGKTTVFNLITGVYQPTTGQIRFCGKSLVGIKPFEINMLGIARTFQNIRLFSSLTVFDNVRVAFNQHLRGGLIQSLWRGHRFAEEEASTACRVMEILSLFELDHCRNLPARSLPYGDQRRLEIVRALATQPRLLLLDEPAAGMNPTEKGKLMNLIQFVKDKYKIAVLLVDHDMAVVMGICQRLIVLDYGVTIGEGTPQEVRVQPAVIEAYLGKEH